MTAGQSLVAVAQVEGSVYAAVRRAMEEAAWREHIPYRARVALKPNLGWDLFVPGSVTSPWVLEGVIQVLRDHVADIVVVESDQVLVSCERAAQRSGIQAVCERYGIEFVNLSRREQLTLDDPGLSILRGMRVPRLLREREIITVPVMKTHNKTVLTGALKNQWGCLEKLRHSLHLVVDDALAEVNRVVRPCFAVVDATVAMEGNAPKSGKPRVVGKVLAGADLVAVDAVLGWLMGIPPRTVRHLATCAAAGVGTQDFGGIRIVGGPVEPIDPPFERAHDNLVSKVEMAFRRSRLSRLVFRTRLFDVMCWGAELYYLLWYYLGPGRTRCRTVLEHPFYGAQWTDALGNRSSGAGANP